MKKALFIIIVVISMAISHVAHARLVSQQSVNIQTFDVQQRVNSGMPSHAKQSLQGNCFSGGQAYCQNRWSGKTVHQLVPVGYDPVSGYMIMRPLYAQ